MKRWWTTKFNESTNKWIDTGINHNPPYEILPRK